jgi:RNA polymerase sigma factor (sigma-70 family)
VADEGDVGDEAVGADPAGEPADLAVQAAAGDERAWSALVDRYVGMVHAICRAHRLYGSDADDVNQVVWLRLVESLDRLRSPAAVGAWIATTARRECLRVLRASARVDPLADVEALEPPVEPEPLEALLANELAGALWASFAKLSSRCQGLLRLLIVDPRPSYEEIGMALEMPIGSIGPTRARCLDALRRLL